MKPLAVKLETTVSRFYCQLALELCQIARLLASEGKHKEAAEMCEFISTLCERKPLSVCKEESRLCRASAEARRRGNYEKADELCLRARRLCPRNFEARGG
ncbi:MAG: hypothetical protein DRJ56_05680 [Thermoprotei archaeon]|nr:MAG: hypothetical protein DRJ56_05680 [Thermoprotei archaeon]